MNYLKRERAEVTTNKHKNQNMQNISKDGILLVDKQIGKTSFQTVSILKKYGMSGTTIALKHVLHLKSGAAYLEKNNLVASGEFVEKHEFQKYNLVKIDDDESYAANCIWINGKVLIAQGFPKTKKVIEQAGYVTIEIDVSEFRKVDGGLSCLSLRF